MCWDGHVSVYVSVCLDVVVCVETWLRGSHRVASVCMCMCMGVGV